MKIIRAGKRLDRAVDALLELKEDYPEVVEAAEISYELEITIDKINSLRTAVDSLTG